MSQHAGSSRSIAMTNESNDTRIQRRVKIHQQFPFERNNIAKMLNTKMHLYYALCMNMECFITPREDFDLKT